MYRHVVWILVLGLAAGCAAGRSSVNPGGRPLPSGSVPTPEPFGSPINGGTPSASVTPEPSAAVVQRAQSPAPDPRPGRPDPAVKPATYDPRPELLPPANSGPLPSLDSPLAALPSVEGESEADVPYVPAPMPPRAMPEAPPRLTDGRTQVAATPAPAASTALPLRPDASKASFTTTGRTASQTAARVGDDVITLYDLDLGVQEWLARNAPGQPLQKEELNKVASIVLDDLIDRTLLIQEVRRKMGTKAPQVWEKFTEFANNDWKEKEMPPLLRQYKVANEYELRTKLEKEGKSLDDIKSNYRLSMMAKDYMRTELGPKLAVELHEMLTYYRKHINEFQRPEEVTWREIEINVDKCRDRAEAQLMALRALDRLRRGVDFAALARASSHGVTASQGGLWKTGADSYAVPGVNAVLKSLQVGWTSQVIEGPESFHIVRIEARRPAGPTPFEEVQDKIRDLVFRDKLAQHANSYLAKLRGQTQISSIFDGTSSAPSLSNDQARLP